MGKIALNVAALLEQIGENPMDLTRSGLAQGTAYRLAKGIGTGITFETLAQLCDYFSAKLGRTVETSEILLYIPDK